MQAIQRFLKIEDAYKDLVKKMIPSLEERDDFEAEYQYKLPCPMCGDDTASGLYYRMNNTDKWMPAGDTMKCSDCRGREAFKVYQNKSLEELKDSIRGRLENDYLHIPENLMDAGFKNYKETNRTTAAAKHKAVCYYKDFINGDRYNLLIMGSPGTGKSHLSSAIARALNQIGFSVGFLTTGVLLSMIKETWSDGAIRTEAGIFRDLKRLDFLVLDDLGSEAHTGKSDWSISKIFEVVESRSGKPTIYTSNFDDLKLPSAIGDRVASRLYDNTKFIDLFTDDYRKTLQRK